MSNTSLQPDRWKQHQMLVKPVNKVVFAELNLMSAFYSKTFAISCLNTSGYPHLTCTLSPEGSPLGQDPEVSGWV